LLPDAGAMTKGTATIHFDPHEVSGDANGDNLKMWGAAQDFAMDPGCVVSVSKFEVIDLGDLAANWNPQDLFDVHVDTANMTNEHMEIQWNGAEAGNGRVEIKEISYMVVGEA
jgi:hypothetical protein